VELGKITIVLDVPQLSAMTQRLVDALDRLGVTMADHLEPIRVEVAQLRELFAAIDTEAAQFAERLLAASTDPAAVQTIALELRDLRSNLTQKIATIVPDAPLEPPPAPAPGA
jgi:hypothetical protein